MMNSISLSRNALMLCLTILNSSCAFSQQPSLPRLENRTLRISPKVPGFEYTWRECKVGLFGNCRKWELHTEYYDLTDPVVKKQLIDMNFVGRVRDKILP